MKYFVYPCIFEAKLGCGVIKIDRLIEEGFIDLNYLTVLNNECCYICCKKAIEFLFDCTRSCHIQYTCGNIKEPVCCIDLIEFGGEDLCYKCKKLLCSYFKYILIKV